MQVNYELSKKAFLRIIEEKLSANRFSLYHTYTKKNIDHMIAHKLANPRNFPKYKVVKKSDGTYILALRQKNPPSVVQVLSWDDMFDVFMPLHEINHDGRINLLKYIHRNNLEFKYKFLSMCLSYFRLACNVCVESRGKLVRYKASESAAVHIIAMDETRPNGTFRYMLIYVNRRTGFVILRPLAEMNHLEIATELLKIFTQFEPPVELVMHGDNPKLTDKVQKVFNVICSQFKMSVEHEPVSFQLTTVVTDRLQEWMERSKSQAWQIGCFIVQSEMNRDPRRTPTELYDEHSSTPYDLYFHTVKADLNLLHNNTTPLTTDDNRTRKRKINISEYTDLVQKINHSQETRVDQINENVCSNQNETIKLNVQQIARTNAMTTINTKQVNLYQQLSNFAR